MRRIYSEIPVHKKLEADLRELVMRIKGLAGEAEAKAAATKDEAQRKALLQISVSLTAQARHASAARSILWNAFVV